ncbi:MAG: lactonase family protein [Clostridiaceae bacterium]|nr:lactonase family protein [Clostridiaceae bacterium]
MANLPQNPSFNDKEKISSVLCLVGTYSFRGSKGIYPLSFDAATGHLSAAGEPAALENPTYLAEDRLRGLIFAVSETNQYHGRFGGSLASFKRSPDTNQLHLIDQQPSGGSSPCHLLVDSGRRRLVVANYGSGSATILDYLEDGRLILPADPAACLISHKGSGPDPDRQEGPHVHHVSLTPDGKHLNLVDLGLDQIVTYPWPIASAEAHAASPLASLTCPPGTGPRHLVYGQEPYVYAVMEMGSEVLALQAESDSYRLTQRISTLPEACCPSDNTGAAIRLSPDGRWLLASNRGHDSLAIYAVDPTNGRLTWTRNESCGGRVPRDFYLLPQAAGPDFWILAASQEDDRICVYRMDAQNGTMTGPCCTFQVPAPVCLLPLH